jgi:hypothetical protein
LSPFARTELVTVPADRGVTGDATMRWAMVEGPSDSSEQALFQELCAAASRLGVDVRVEPFDTPVLRAGGLCSLRGTRLVLLDGHASIQDRLWALAGALATLGVDEVYVAPAARELIERLQLRAGHDDGLRDPGTS